MTDSANTLPRKKPNILWWIAGIFALAAFWFFYQLFGPSPAIIVSKQTTYLTEPLGKDGLPDYEKYILERYRDGITPEDNAAVLIWQAMWPSGLKPEHFRPVIKELGLHDTPSEDDVMEPLEGAVNRQRVVDWLKTQIPNIAPDNPATHDETTEDADELRPVEGLLNTTFMRAKSVDFNLLAQNVLSQVLERAWTTEQIPPLAEWIEKNHGPIELLVKASKRPRCYFPSPSLLDNQREPLMTMLLPGQQGAREAVRALVTRAMWNLGEGQHDAAWQNVLAAHRLACLVGQGRTLIDQLIATNMSRQASIATLSILDDKHLPADLARQIRDDLASLPPVANVGDAFDGVERIWALDALLQMRTGGISTLTPNRNNLSIGRMAVDWNDLLTHTNRRFDSIVAAARRRTSAERFEANREAWGELESRRGLGATVVGWLHGSVSRRVRTEILAATLGELLLPASGAALNVQDGAVSRLDLVRLAAALAEYRAVHGQYPDSLSDLVPETLVEAPLDYNGNIFVFKRIGDGFLLYSLGNNGTDDGGSNGDQRLHEGRPFDDLSEAELRTPPEGGFANGDDWSVRLPRPRFEIPK